MLTKYEFRKLFTLDEKVSIEIKKKTDPILAVLNADMDSAESIDLDSPEITEGMGYLVKAGVLTEERMKQILSEPQISSSSNPMMIKEPVFVPKFKVAIPQDEKNPVEWVTGFLTADATVRKTDGFLLIETSGDCTAPNTALVEG